jgi:hypothetical protein
MILIYAEKGKTKKPILLSTMPAISSLLLRSERGLYSSEDAKQRLKDVRYSRTDRMAM